MKSNYCVTVHAKLAIEINVDAESEDQAKWKAVSWSECPSDCRKIVHYWDAENNLIEDDGEMCWSVRDILVGPESVAIEWLDEVDDETEVQP